MAILMSFSVDKFKPTRKAGLLNQAKDAISATNNREKYFARESWTNEEETADKTQPTN
jgi:hypothetical protein